MNVEHPFTVAILASYFALIFVLVWRVKRELQMVYYFNHPGVILFALLSLISLLSTWTYMFKFFAHSYQEWKQLARYEQPLSLNSMSYWLKDVSLFDSAWRKVCVGAWQWLWSHQICTLTVSVWTPILAIEGTRRRIPYIWTYMLLGQVVAISFAASLFFAVLLTFEPFSNRQPSSRLLKTLTLSSVGGILTVVLCPFVADTDAFMGNLLAMHILLIFPLVYTESSTPLSSKSASTYAAVLYALAAGANLSIYANQWFTCLATLAPFNQHTWYQIYDTAITTFFSHPAQSSVSYDIVCMQLISVAWMYTVSQRDYQHVPSWVWILIAVTPLMSSSFTLPLFFAGYEYSKAIQTSAKKIN
ncbi:hypothetical protein BD408DRAFT_415554 [Parasitella parasitica]|nr:hypothetical protein BD408DRAFT_415554 [Parasitella parasitica]